MVGTPLVGVGAADVGDGAVVPIARAPVLGEVPALRCGQLDAQQTRPPPLGNLQSQAINVV